MTAPAAPRRRPRWRRWLRVILPLGFCYLGVCVVMLALERWLLFYPTPHTRHWQAPPAELRAHDVTWTLGDGTVIHAWWCAPEGWRPDHGALLYAHGNAGNLSHRAEGVKRWMARMKVAVLIFDYPG